MGGVCWLLYLLIDFIQSFLNPSIFSDYSLVVWLVADKLTHLFYFTIQLVNLRLQLLLNSFQGLTSLKLVWFVSFEGFLRELKLALNTSYNILPLLIINFCSSHQFLNSLTNWLLLLV